MAQLSEDYWDLEEDLSEYRDIESVQEVEDRWPEQSKSWSIKEAGEFLADLWQRYETRYGRKGALTMALAMAASFPIPGNIAAVIAAAEAVRAAHGWFSKSLSLEWKHLEMTKSGGTCKPGQTAANTGCTPASDDGGSLKEKPAQRIDSIVHEANNYRFEDRMRLSIGINDFDAIEEAMTPSEREKMRRQLDQYREDWVNEQMDNYSLDRREIIQSLNLSRDDIIDAVSKIVDSYDLSADELEKVMEVVNAIDYRSHGDEAVGEIIDGIRSELPEADNLIQELEEYQERVRGEIEDEEEQWLDNVREEIAGEYDSAEDRIDYLRQFYQENEDRFQVSAEEGVWYKSDAGWESRFSTPAGEYTIDAIDRKHPEIPVNVNVQEIRFNDPEGNYQATGKAGAKEALTVFRKVIPAVVSMMQRGDNDVTYFSAAEPNRQKLYETLTRTTAAAMPGYSAFSKMKEGIRYFFVVKNDKVESFKEYLKETQPVSRAISDDPGDDDSELEELPLEVNPDWWDESYWEESDDEADLDTQRGQYGDEALAELDKAGGTCKPGQTAANTGCTPASGEGGERDSGKKPSKKERQPKGRVPEPRPSAKAERAKQAHVLVDKYIQRYAEEHNEKRFASVVKGRSLPDGEPPDIESDDAGIELKTLVSNTNDKLTMDSYSQIRKLVWEKETGKVFHTVVSDDRLVFNANGPGQHDETKRVYYYRRGVAGSARVGSLLRVRSEKELKKLMAMPEDQLPPQAQRTDGELRQGRWVAFKDSEGKGFRDRKSGRIVRAKK